MVNVQYPAPVSMNTTAVGSVVRHYVVRSVLAQMLATSEKWKQEVMAPSKAGRLLRHAGVNQHKRYYVSSFIEAMGGGAASYRDGTDSGDGNMNCPNVEWLEMNFPLLYLFRRHMPDGMGAGKFRGGAGTEVAFTVHNAPEGKVKLVAAGAVGQSNSGQGISGGYPGVAANLVLFEGTKTEELMAQNKSPVDLAELGGHATILGYCECDLKNNDVLWRTSGSGGGYGDPLERDPSMVLKDVTHGIVSREMASRIYGVVLDGQGHEMDNAATSTLRAKLKAGRVG